MWNQCIHIKRLTKKSLILQCKLSIGVCKPLNLSIAPLNLDSLNNVILILLSTMLFEWTVCLCWLLLMGWKPG